MDVHEGDLRPRVRGTGIRRWEARTLPYLSECRQGAFQQVHLGEREEEREGRLGPLVPVDPIFLEPVATAPGSGVIQLLPEVVAAEEPLEGGPGLVQPAGVLCRPVRLEAGGDRRIGLDRLLVE